MFLILSFSFGADFQYLRSSFIEPLSPITRTSLVNNKEDPRDKPQFQAEGVTHVNRMPKKRGFRVSLG